MFCPKCGGQADENDRFCLNCGARLTEAAAPEPPVQPKPVKKKKIASKIIIGVLCVILIGVAYHTVSYLIAVQNHQKVKQADLDRLVSEIQEGADKLEEYSDLYFNFRGRGNETWAEYNDMVAENSVDQEVALNSATRQYMLVHSSFDDLQERKGWDEDDYQEYADLYSAYYDLYDFFKNLRSTDREAMKPVADDLWREYRNQYNAILKN